METYLNFMGEDFVADVDYYVSDYGSPPIIDYVHGGDPGSDPEWDILSITLMRDIGGGVVGPAFEATGALFDVLAADEDLNDQIRIKIEEEGPPRRSRRGRSLDWFDDYDD